MIVSHDTGFLDATCTDIIHYEERKLVLYRGNLSAFVAKVPSAKSYYELAESATKFAFPAPGRLEGIATTTKAIVKLETQLAAKAADAAQLTFELEGRIEESSAELEEARQQVHAYADAWVAERNYANAYAEAWASERYQANEYANAWNEERESQLSRQRGRASTWNPYADRLRLRSPEIGR